MAAAQKLEQLKSRLENLGRDSLDVVTRASRIVIGGVQKLAEQELTALNDYYRDATSSLRSERPRNAAGVRDLATQQLDLLQDTVQKLIGHARASLSILSETREELARLTSLGTPASERALAKVTAPAQKAIKDVQKLAAEAQKTAARTAREVEKTLKKEIASAEKAGKAAVKKGEAKARAVGKTVKKRLESVLDVAPPATAKKTVSARPSAESRANRATSKAKKQPVKPT